MPAIPYVKKKTGSSYLVWFQNSNMYIQLEEPAWFVFRKTTQRYKTETIAKEFAIRYCNSPEESLSFVKEIRAGIEKLNQTSTTQNERGQEIIRSQENNPGHENIRGHENNPDQDSDDDLNKLSFTAYSIHHYRLGNKVITFSYETCDFEQYLHPLICHYETTEVNKEMPLFELFGYQECIVFRFNGEVKGSWTSDETHLVKGMIFMFLINVMHDKTDADWLTAIHASAITNERKTILFTAPPGNGKTTIAALLQTRGFTLISDDFVPIDKDSYHAYPFPIAMSVKEGSMALLSSLYPTLERSPLNYITPEKSVRYISINKHLDVTNDVFPVQEIVFVHYNPSVDFLMEKLDLTTALKLLLDQAWVAPMQDNAALFLEWVLHISFFQLTYSNNQKALEAITNLFDHD